jgi:hypothetical protein
MAPTPIRRWRPGFGRIPVITGTSPPTGACWLNLVERFFAEITDKRIRRGTFCSVGELVRAIRDYIRRRNHRPRPFVWTASARSIARKVRRCNEVLEQETSGWLPRCWLRMLIKKSREFLL